jgi:hypothetical protein
VQVLAGTGDQIANQAQRVVIPPGQRRFDVRIPVLGNTITEPAADTIYKVFVTDPANAVIGQDFAHLTVHDDDVAAPRTGTVS